MIKRLLVVLLGGLSSLGLYAQTEYTIIADLTSKVANANFLEGDAVTEIVRTYDYDMPDAGAGSDEGGVSLFGQQAVPGWDAANLTDNIKVSESSSNARTDGLNARAGGLFAYVDDSSEEAAPGMGGADYIAPYLTDEAQQQALGFVAVWGATIQYTQDITLPAGDYQFTVKLFNTAGAGTMTQNLIGFVAEDGTEYYAEATSYRTDEWIYENVIIRLSEETKGKLSLGYHFSNNGSGSAPHIFVDNVKLYQIDSKQLDQEEIDAAKADLYEVIEKGRSYNVDVTEALKVYNDPNATLEQVLAAIEKQNEINESGLTDLSEFFITNPHFNQDEVIEGGICTYDYDCEKNNIATTNYSMLPLTGWTRMKTDNGCASGVYAIGSDAFLGGAGYLPPKTMSDGSDEGKVLGFVTCWTMAVQYRQQVVLPKGKYSLSISYYNSGGTSAIAKNLIGFIADDGTEYLFKKTQFSVGSWLQESIEFELDEETSGYFSLGYQSTNTGSGNMPHFFVDGISLIYVGTGIDPSYIALQAAVSAAKQFETEEYYSELKGQLDALIAEGEDLLDAGSTDEDVNRKVIDALTELLPAVRENVNAYHALAEFYEEGGALANAIEKYNEEEFADLNGELNLIGDAAMEALSDYNLTTEEVNALMESLNTTIEAGIQKLWDEAVESGEELEKSLDISPLFSQLTFDGSISNWYSTSSSLKTSYGTAENWNATSFTTQRTLTEMPAGTYTITTRAFYRLAANAANYAAYQDEETYEPLAFLFAGNNTTPLANVAQVASEDASEISGSAEITDAGVYVPNTQQGAYQVFTSDKYAEIVETKVSTVLEQEGNLTFGIKASGMQSDCWVVWYSMTVEYNALDADLLDLEIERLTETSATLIENENMRVDKAKTDLEAGIASGEDALDADTDAKVAAIIDMKNAIAYAQQSLILLNSVSNTANEYLTLRSEYDYPSTSGDFDDLISEVDEIEYDTNDDIPATTDKIAAAWVAYVSGKDLSTATDETPVDITEVILNPNFDTSASHWTFNPDSIQSPIGQNQQRNNTTYTNEEAEVTVNSFIEAWRPSGTHLNNGVVGQTIAGPLPKGYYLLEADGFATNQVEIPEEGITGAYLYAGYGTEEYVTSMGIDSIGAYPQHFSVVFYSDGENPVTVGLKLKDTTASWILADNFTLKAIGTTEPDAIIAIEDLGTAALEGKDAIYNVAGQRVGQVQKGIYIVGGKKVLVK